MMSRCVVPMHRPIEGMDAFGPTAIIGFRGRNSWLSTWTRNPVRGYPTAEHAYQALKSPKDAEAIRAIVHPKDIPRLTVLGWNREAGMKTIIGEAFALTSPLAAKLLDTGDRVLICTDDEYRGLIIRTGYIRGQNTYGKVLMEQREVLKRQVEKIVKLQRRWKEALVNPEYEICRRVRMKAFEELEADIFSRK